MTRRPPRSTRTDTLFPDTALFRSNRFVRWRKLGVWDRIFAAVSAAYAGDLQMVDSSSVRVHQHAANVKRGVRRTPPLGTELTPAAWRSEEHTSELQSLMRISYAVFCLTKKTQKNIYNHTQHYLLYD